MGEWNYNQYIVLIINVIGGIAVIGSYVQGILSHPGTGNALWGGIPSSMRLYYTIGMLLSAAGYFAFSYFILFRIEPEGLKIAGVFNYLAFAAIFFIILGASSLWMPLTYNYINNPDHGTWIGIRIVLFTVAIGTLLLVLSLLTMRPREISTAYWLAVGGATAFFLHTGILDAFLWPALFRK
jgi:uncharacterized membrane protein